MESQDDNIKINKEVIGSNLLWRFLERFGAYFVSFVISIVLARILDPSTYGVVAIMTVIISFLDIFVTAGFANSLIYDKKATSKDFNTVLIFNISFSLILYVILFFVSPLIANFYGKPILSGLIRVSGLSLIINAYKNLEHAYISKHLQFRKFFFSTIGGTIVSGVVGIVMAVKGLGAWALVVQGVLNHFIDTVILFFVIEWKPKFEFEFSLLKKHLAFGTKIFVSKIVYNLSNSVRQLVIGKKYSDNDLAFYNKGKTYPNIFGQNITSSISSVIYPVLTRSEDNPSRFNYILNKSFQINMYVILPLMIGMACVSESFINLLIGSKWIESAQYIKIFAVVVVFNTVESVFSSTALALGKSTQSMIFEILDCIVSILFLLVAIPFGVKAIAYSMLASSIFNAVLHMIVTYKLTRLNIFNSLLSLWKTLLSLVVMVVVIVGLSYIKLPYYLTFIIQVLIGAFVYLFINYIIKNDTQIYCFNYLKGILGNLTKGKHNNEKSN